MTLYDVKPHFQDLLRPIVIKLYCRGVTANNITLLAMIFSILLGGMLAFFSNPNFFIILPVFLFIRMALNAIDGMLAREFNQQSTLGAILNEVGDLISDAALYTSFVFLPGVSSGLVVFIILLSWLSEFCGVISQTLTGIRDYHGPLGKSDRAFLFGASGLVIACWPQYTGMLNFVFGISLPLLIWTCINRCRKAMERKNV